MKRIFAALLAAMLVSCAATKEAVREDPPEQTPEQAFCDMAISQMQQNEKAAQARAMESGLDLSMEVTKCDLLSDVAGRLYYTVETSVGSNQVLTIDAVAIIIATDAGWQIVKDAPIYVIDHVHGEFKWFVKDELPEQSGGQEI